MARSKVRRKKYAKNVVNINDIQNYADYLIYLFLITRQILESKSREMLKQHLKQFSILDQISHHLLPHGLLLS